MKRFNIQITTRSAAFDVVFDDQNDSETEETVARDLAAKLVDKANRWFTHGNVVLQIAHIEGIVVSDAAAGAASEEAAS